MWTWDYFFKNIFSGFATFLSVLAIIWVYKSQKRDKKMEGARVLLAEIRNAENGLDEIKKTGVISDLTFVLPSNSWEKSQHLFIKDFDQDELRLMNTFYYTCASLEKQIQRIKSYLPLSNEEKVKLVQQKLLELAEKYKNSTNNFDRNSDYQKEKRQVLDNLFYQEADWFVPKAPTNSLASEISLIRYISTSSCDVKLKRIARFK